MLPSPPNEVEKYLYFKQGKLFFYSGGLLSFIALFTGMIFFARQTPEFYWYYAFSFLTMVYISLSYFIGMFGHDRRKDYFDDLISFHKRHDRKPTVDVFLPTCGEDLSVLENTYKGVQNICYYNKAVFVLDDAKRPEVKALAQKFDFHYVTREDNSFKKAGNLRNAFKNTCGEFILILDADFVPSPDILECMLPYTVDGKVAIVQTPQYFNVQGNWVEKGAAYVQEIFYRLIQTSRNDWCGGSICVGTCALYRRTALEPFGGTAEIEHSEDVHTGFNCVSLGYEVVYLPAILAKGLCPDNLGSFFVQQKRWCMGSMSLLFSKKFWVNKIGFQRRLCYISGMLYYIFTALSVLLCQVPTVLMIHLYPEGVNSRSILLSVPSLLFGTLWLAAWSVAPWGVYALRVRIVQGWAHLFAITEKLTGNVSHWIPTGLHQVKAVRYKIVCLAYNSLMWCLFMYPAVLQWMKGNHNVLLPAILITFFSVISVSTVFGD